MPHGKPLSQSEQGRIGAYHEVGYSNRKIAAQIGRSLDCVNRYLKDPTTYGKNHKGGRPKSLTPQDERHIARKASNSQLSTNEIRNDLRLNVHRTTVLRSIHSNKHIVRQKLKTAPKLTNQHKKKRLDFARANLTTSWDKIVFSDEKKFNLDGPDGFAYYWRDLRKEPQYFPKRNFGGGSVMIWGAFGYDGTLDLEFLTPRMNSLDYQNVLDKQLLPYLQQGHAMGLTFQQDNASIHTSRSTMDWLSAKNVNVLDWPACPPYLNPIENLWGILVRKIYARLHR